MRPPRLVGLAPDGRRAVVRLLLRARRPAATSRPIAPNAGVRRATACAAPWRASCRSPLVSSRTLTSTDACRRARRLAAPRRSWLGTHDRCARSSAATARARLAQAARTARDYYATRYLTTRRRSALTASPTGSSCRTPSFRSRRQSGRLPCSAGPRPRSRQRRRDRSSATETGTGLSRAVDARGTTSREIVPLTQRARTHAHQPATTRAGDRAGLGRRAVNSPAATTNRWRVTAGQAEVPCQTLPTSGLATHGLAEPRCAVVRVYASQRKPVAAGRGGSGLAGRSPSGSSSL